MSDGVRFYDLSPPFPGEVYSVYGEASWGRRFRPLEWDADVDFESIGCPVYRGHTRLGRRIGQLGIVIGSLPKSEVLWTGTSELVVTDAFAAELRAQNFTGLSLEVVRVGVRRRLKGKAAPKLWVVAVQGSPARVTATQGLRPLFRCPHCGFEPYSSYPDGIQVDQASWSGADFFQPVPRVTPCLVSEAVKEFILARRPLNCALIETRDMRWPKGSPKPEDVWPPGSESAPDDRVAEARALANSLGFKLKP